MIDYGYNQPELCWGTSGPVTEAEVREVLQTIRDLGGSRVRMAVNTGSIAELDQAVLLCREYGLKPLLGLFGSAAFGYLGTLESFGTYCRNIATRYGPLGVGNLRNTVTEYQLGNEANLVTNPPYTNGSGAAFAKYLRAGGEAIKAVHTSATVIAGGTTAEGWFSTSPLVWYQDIINAGAADFVDAFALHFYVDQDPALSSPVWKSILDVRALMVAKGLGAKKIWVTEVGVSFPWPGIRDAVHARDRLKTMIDGILAQDFMGPFFVFSLREYAGGGDAVVGGKFGMVTNTFVPKTPIYEYAKTIAGTPSDPLDIIPPGDPTGLTYSDVMSTSVQFTWNPNPTIDGVSNYRLKTVAGVQLADTPDTHVQLQGLPSGTPQSFRVFAVDAAGNESPTGSNVVTLTTDAPSGSQSSFTFQFSGSTVPTQFTQLGLGFTVSSGVALPTPPTVDGKYTTVAPYTLDAQSPDHSSRISMTGLSHGDRSGLAIVRMKPDGTEWVAAGSPGGGKADALVIFTCIAGKVVAVKAMNTTPTSDDLLLTVTGNTYTARVINPAAVITAELVWTDINGVFPGAANLRPGLGWRHIRSKSRNYAPPGITGWAATDVAPILPAGGFDPWMLAVIDEEDLGLVLSTGLWEAGL